MAKLHFTDKNFQGRVYELLVEKTTVGRGEHNTLVIADDSVSVNHCEILNYGEEVIVRDRGSSNGTFVDGVRVEGQMPIHNSQILRFGAVEARVQVPLSRTSETSTDMTAVYEYGKAMRDLRREKKKPSDPHLRIEPSSAHVATAEEQTVLLPNPRSTQKLTPLSPAPTPVEPPRRQTTHSTRYIIVGVLAVLAAILIWLFRR